MAYEFEKEIKIQLEDSDIEKILSELVSEESFTTLESVPKRKKLSAIRGVLGLNELSTTGDIIKEIIDLGN